MTNRTNVQVKGGDVMCEKKYVGKIKLKYITITFVNGEYIITRNVVNDKRKNKEDNDGS